MRIAVLDMGSNSTHLQLAELEPGAPPRLLASERASLRLGELSEGRIPQALWDEALSSIGLLVELARAEGAERIEATGTAAMRDALNGAALANTLAESLALDVRVLSGEEEARLAYLGAWRRLELGHRPALVFDLGGRSTEIALGVGPRVRRAISLPMGHLSLAQLQREQDHAALVRHIDATLEPAVEALRGGSFAIAVGTAGTAMTLVRMAAALRDGVTPPGRHGLRARVPLLARTVAALEAASPAQRLEMPGFDARRADTILPGAIAVLRLCQALGISELTSSEGGLREGLVEDMRLRLFPAPALPAG